MIQRQRIKLVSGIPLIMTLEDAAKGPFQSRFTDQSEWLYNVNVRGEASQLYLAVEGHTALQRLGAKAGDEIQILKQQTQGQAPSFSARFVSDATLAVPSLPAPDPNRRAPADRFDTHMQQQQPGVRMLAPQPQTNGATAYAPQQAKNEAPQPGSVALGQCLLAAIDAAIGAERYALAKGKTLSFNEEDVRAMGLSIYIGKQREGR